MKRIRLINLILIMFCCCNMLAQNITVTGQVVDVTSEPIIGASVVVKGTTNGTITDFDGNFTLSVQKGETLHISYIGYVAQDVKVMGNQPVKVVMAEDTETLDEVVVVGTSMKKSDLTGAVASVSSKVLEEKTGDECKIRLFKAVLQVCSFLSLHVLRMMHLLKFVVLIP